MNGVPVPQEDRSQWISSKPVGFRDIYWCSRQNEPVMLTYKDNQPICSHCGYDDILDEVAHTFLGNVRKPC